MSIALDERNPDEDVNALVYAQKHVRDAMELDRQITDLALHRAREDRLSKAFLHTPPQAPFDKENVQPPKALQSHLAEQSGSAPASTSYFNRLWMP